MKIEHHMVDFEPLRRSGSEKLAVGSFGPAGSGKTRLGATMPGKIGVVPLNRKTRPTLEKVARELRLANGKIVLPKTDFIRQEKPMAVAQMGVDAAIEHYKAHKYRIMDAIYTLAGKSDIDSILIDDGTQLKEDILFSHYGRSQRIMPRDRGPANQDWRDILNACQGKHLLVTHQASEIWKNDKPTGDYSWNGYNALDYYMSVIVEHEHDPNGEDANFHMSVRLSQERPELQGEEGERILSDDQIRFTVLAALIYPDLDLEE